ncbi:hypothetical protein [Streptomyces sp. NPDC085540]|uniref:hypothetical protein n=1 Tax=Streptomyces sp. NPDC085540 TaxID=3365730 RepID=UPI0037D84D31
MFPALERALVLTSLGGLLLLDRYRTPAAIRRMGTARLARWLRARGVRTPAELAATAFEAAEQQHTAVLGKAVIAQLVRTLAADVRVLNEKVAEADRFIEDRFRAHDLAEIIMSTPGIGPLFGAEFPASAGSGLAFSATPDRPTPPLPPRPPARLLHVRPDQRPLRPHLPDLLRPQTRRGENAALQFS